MSDRLPKRQGDIRLVPVGTQPVDGRSYTYRARGEGIIVAAGEATGHHHRVRDTHARMFDTNDGTFITVSKNGATLEHEEHAPIDLEPGTYQVKRQREMEPPTPKEIEARRQNPASNPWRSRQVWD